MRFAARLVLYGLVLASLFMTGGALALLLSIELSNLLLQHPLREGVLVPLACIGGLLSSAAIARPLWRFWSEQDRQRLSEGNGDHETAAAPAVDRETEKEAHG